MSTALPPGESLDPAPRFASRDAYLAAVHRLEPWLPVLRIIAEREGLPDLGEPRVTTSHKAPTFFIEPSYYVKLFPGWERRHDAFARELEGYRLVEADPSLPVPSLLGSGMVGTDCRYLLISSIDGRSLKEVRADVPESEMLEIASWCGRLLHRFHSLDIDPERREAGYRGFVAKIEQAREAIARRLAKRSLLNPQLLDQLDDWLPSTEAMVGSSRDAVVVHGSFRYSHIHVASRSGAYEAIGTIDLGRARIGHPMYDLCDLWRSLRSESPAVREHVMKEAQFPGYGTPEFSRVALSWAILQRSAQSFYVPQMADLTNLDDLAMLTFGEQ